MPVSTATRIEWTEVTWNPTTGCDRISPGCDNCYALTLAKRLQAMGQPRYQCNGDPRTSGPGFGVTEHADVLEEPLRWRKPRKVFVNSMSDIAHRVAGRMMRSTASRIRPKPTSPALRQGAPLHRPAPPRRGRGCSPVGGCRAPAAFLRCADDLIHGRGVFRPFPAGDHDVPGYSSAAHPCNWRVNGMFPASSPPSARSTMPVTQAASREDRNSAARAMSSGSPSLPGGYHMRSRSKTWGSRASQATTLRSQHRPDHSRTALPACQGRSQCGPNTAALLLIAAGTTPNGCAVRLPGRSGHVVKAAVSAGKPF